VGQGLRAPRDRCPSDGRGDDGPFDLHGCLRGAQLQSQGGHADVSDKEFYFIYFIFLTFFPSIFLLTSTPSETKQKNDNSLFHRRKADGPYDSRVLPVLLGSMLMGALTIVFFGSVAELAGW